MTRLLVSALSSVALAACGGGTLALQLTDAPTDDLVAAVVTIAQAQGHIVDKSANQDGDPSDTSIDGDDRWHSLDLQARTFDLLQLRDDVTEGLGQVEVPEGKLTQVRLFIDSAGTNAVTLRDATVCPLDLSEVPVAGVKISHPFKAYDIDSGTKLTVVLDFALDESLSTSGPGCTYKLKPVIKIRTDLSLLEAQ